MAWIQKKTTVGINFHQIEQADALICSLSCRRHLENALIVRFASNTPCEAFSIHLNALVPGLKQTIKGLDVTITFPSNVNVLNKIVAALQKIERLPEDLVDKLSNAFNLNEHQRLKDLKSILENRVALIKKLLDQINLQDPQEYNKQEAAAEILSLLPKETNGKLQEENHHLATYLASSDFDRKRAKEIATRKTIIKKFADPEQPQAIPTFIAPRPKQLKVTFADETMTISDLPEALNSPKEQNETTSYSPSYIPGFSVKMTENALDDAVLSQPHSSSLTALHILKEDRCHSMA